MELILDYHGLISIHVDEVSAMPLLTEVLKEKLESEKIELAIKICEALQKRAAHGKICPKNIQINDGEIIFLDKEPEPKYIDKQWNMWIETENLKASDIYSLGVMFRIDFKLTIPPTIDMVATNPDDRPEMAEVIFKLNARLKEIQKKEMPSEFAIGKHKLIKEGNNFILKIDNYQYDQNLHEKLDAIVAFELALNGSDIPYTAGLVPGDQSFQIKFNADLKKPFKVWEKEFLSAYNSALAFLAESKRLKVNQEHWKIADEFFQREPKAIKYSKKRFEGYNKESGEFHSFTRIGGKIYAVADGVYLGKGGLGTVKLCQEMVKTVDERGKYSYTGGGYFAYKTEGEVIEGNEMMSSVLDKRNEEIHLIKLSGDLQVKQAIRELDPAKAKEIDKTHKVHTVIKLHEGMELFSMVDNKVKKLHLEIPLPHLTPPQKFMLALECCLKIQMLHDKRIIHADIKPENMMADILPEGFIVTPIDFGSAVRLPEGQDSIVSTKPGTVYYAAPEIGITVKTEDGEILKRTSNRYSFASDVYALGMLFKMGFKLHRMDQFPECQKICDEMMKTKPEERLDLLQVIKVLVNELAIIPQNAEIRSAVEKAQKYLKEHSVVAKPAPILPRFQLSALEQSLPHKEHTKPAIDEVPSPTKERQGRKS